MELKLKRSVIFENETIGTLSLNGVDFCYTLEPTQRKEGVKIMGKTAIPKGRYPLVKRYSLKFNDNRWFLLNVPNFTGVMIHEGNTYKDTAGCILLGMESNGKSLLYSKKALKLLHSYLDLVTKGGDKDIFLTVE